MNLPDALDAALAATRAVGTRWGTASDDELLADGEAWEAIGRLVDARRAAFAAEVEARSSQPGEGLRLPARFGLRDGADLVVHVARVSRREAVRRIGIGTDLAAARSLAGERLPGRHPYLAAAVHDGRVGTDSARAITGMLRSVRRRAQPDDLVAAEIALTDLAAEADAEAIRSAAEGWALALDPDGPGDRDAYRQRAFRLGRPDHTGGSRFSGYAPAEQRALLAVVLAQHRKDLAMERSPAGAEVNDGPGPQWRELDGAQRTVPQIDFDTLDGLLTGGVRAAADGSTGAGTVRSVPEVIVTTTVDDLERRAGTGTITATGARIPVQAVERISWLCGRPAPGRRILGRAAVARPPCAPVLAGAAPGARRGVRRVPLARMRRPADLVRRAPRRLVPPGRRPHRRRQRDPALLVPSPPDPRPRHPVADRDARPPPPPRTQDLDRRSGSRAPHAATRRTTAGGARPRRSVGTTARSLTARLAPAAKHGGNVTRMLRGALLLPCRDEA